MPNSPSASKRLRQSVKRRKHNRITRKVIKTSMKKTLESVSEHNLEKAQTDYRAAVSKIDKAGVTPGASSQHGRPAQEQARPRLCRRSGQGERGLTSRPPLPEPFWTQGPRPLFAFPRRPQPHGLTRRVVTPPCWRLWPIITASRSPRSRSDLRSRPCWSRLWPGRPIRPGPKRRFRPSNPPACSSPDRWPASSRPRFSIFCAMPAATCRLAPRP